jgi:hypothetical protein
MMPHGWSSMAAGLNVLWLDDDPYARAYAEVFLASVGFGVRSQPASQLGRRFSLSSADLLVADPGPSHVRARWLMAEATRLQLPTLVLSRSPPGLASELLAARGESRAGPGSSPS